MATVDQAKPGALTLFAVQLRRIGVAEISLSCPAFGQPNTVFAHLAELSTGVGPYDAVQRTIHVFVTASSPKPAQNVSAGSSGVSDGGSFRVTVAGEFFIEDEAKLQFPLEKLPVWAGRNGAAVLLPFLREQVYSVTRNTGFAPMLLPLVEVLPFKVNPPTPISQTAEEKVAKV